MIPLYPASGLALANTTKMSASPPLVIHAFAPESAHPFSTRSARVASAKASDPDPGSDSA